MLSVVKVIQTRCSGPLIWQMSMMSLMNGLLWLIYGLVCLYQLAVNQKCHTKSELQNALRHLLATFILSLSQKWAQRILITCPVASSPTICMGPKCCWSSAGKFTADALPGLPKEKVQHIHLLGALLFRLLFVPISFCHILFPLIKKKIRLEK